MFMVEVYLAPSSHVDMILTLLLCSTIRKYRDLLISNEFLLWGSPGRFEETFQVIKLLNLSFEALQLPEAFFETFWCQGYYMLN
jgi:hypothetical protein